MRSVNQLVHSRTRVKQRYALMPLEGFPISRLPTWPDAEVKVLASPALGAQFVQYLIDLPAGKRGQFVPDNRIETFYYVITGNGGYMNGDDIERVVRPGSFGLVPAGGGGVSFEADDPMRIIVLRKVFEPVEAFKPPEHLHSHESNIKREIWADNPHSLLQTLIPDDFQYDLAINIFSFDPGHGLPIVETHVMEHGLFVLEGKGVYYLDGEWMEIEKDDFIWMGPYCPQSYYAAGPKPTRYLYYKNVNREIAL